MLNDEKVVVVLVVLWAMSRVYYEMFIQSECCIFIHRVFWLNDPVRSQKYLDGFWMAFLFSESETQKMWIDLMMQWIDHYSEFITRSVVDSSVSVINSWTLPLSPFRWLFSGPLREWRSAGMSQWAQQSDTHREHPLHRTGPARLEPQPLIFIHNTAAVSRRLCSFLLSSEAAWILLTFILYLKAAYISLLNPSVRVPVFYSNLWMAKRFVGVVWNEWILKTFTAVAAVQWVKSRAFWCIKTPNTKPFSTFNFTWPGVSCWVELHITLKKLS